MKESPTVEINPSKRILKMPGALCGGISTGTDKIRSGYGNGDCLYFDFEHLVFAVADGSERFPWASRDLLNRLSESLAQSGSPDTVCGLEGSDEHGDILRAEVPAQDDFQLCRHQARRGRCLPDNFARRRQCRNGDEQRHRLDMPADRTRYEFRGQEQGNRGCDAISHWQTATAGCSFQQMGSMTYGGFACVSRFSAGRAMCLSGTRWMRSVK